MSRTRYRSPDDPDESLGFDHGRVDWLVDVLGVAVHEAARVAAMAAEGEVLVTAVTRDLATVVVDCSPSWERPRSWGFR
jgi:class 3 adenylate cyclase